MGGIQELLKEHMTEIKESIANNSGDDSKVMLRRLDQIYVSLIEWVKGVSESMSQLERKVDQHHRAVENLRIPAPEVEIVKRSGTSRLSAARAD